MTTVEAAVLRVSIDGVEQVVAKIRAIQAQLRSLHGTADSAGGGGVTALHKIRDAASAVATAHRSAVSRIRGEWSSLVGTFRSVAIGITAIGGAFFGVLKTVQAFDKAQGFRRALALNLGDAEGARVAKATDALAIQQGVDINGVRRGATGLVGAGVQGADRTLQAFLALAAKGGATSEQTGRGLEQLAQIASQGKLQGDELRQIQENLVPLRKLLMDAGLGGRMGSQKDPITWSEVQRELLKVLDDPKIKAAMDAAAKQSSNRWQSAMNRFQVEVIEPMGRNLGPVVVDVSKKVSEWSKSLDWGKVRDFVRKLADMTLGAADWVVKNQDLVLTIGKTILAFRALGIAIDAIKSGQGVASALVGIGGTAAGAAAAGGAAAGNWKPTFYGTPPPGAVAGAAIAGLASTVVAILASAAVAAAAFTLTKQVLDAIGYEEWLADQFEKDPELGYDPKTAEGNRKYKPNRDPSAAKRFSDESRGDDMMRDGTFNPDRPNDLWGGYGKDAMGRKLKFSQGVTKAERNAAMAYAIGQALR